MNKNFNTALENAFNKEFSWLNHFENPCSTHVFSSQFESRMNSIIPKSELTYVSIGQRRIRKTFLAALIALLAIIITGCAFTVYYIVEWHEVQNDNQGTLDIGFHINGNLKSNLNTISLPETPKGYTIVSETSDDFSYVIQYANGDALQILFTRYSEIENMSASIDNEDAAFESTTVNGYKGYSYFKDGINALYWADTTYFYILQGTCEMDVLRSMTESIYR